MNNLKTAYLSLGSNLGDKLNNLQEAVFLLEKKTGKIKGLSHIYQSPSLGFKSDDFLNACVELETTLAPEKLLVNVLDIESQLGRVRTNEQGYQPRTIDIDILYYDHEIIDSEHLQVPHPNMQKRRFVLRPLVDIAAQFYHPVLKKDTRNLLQQCKDKSVLQKTPYKLLKDRQQLFSQLHFITLEGAL